VTDRVIIPKVNAAANCEILQCTSCNLSRARQHKTEVVKSKAIESSVGAISCNKYVPGDFFSMDQYVVKEPCSSPTDFGREAEHNMFHGGTIFCDAY
jgi:hypothetical protein